jgi:aminoglycoside 6'-N-acetyltransferase I
MAPHALWPHAAAEHPQEIDAYLDDLGAQSAVFVAEHPSGGGLSGFLEVRLRNYADGCSSSPVAYIEGWYVDPEVRRAGVGAALLKAAEGWSRNLGLTEVASDSDLRNDLGRRVHLALGFQEVGRIVEFRKSLKGAV